MVEIEAHAEGAVLPVKALPGARKAEIRGVQNGALRVSVTQVAEKGKANKAFVELLAKQLGVRKSQVELLAGETASQKKFLIRGVSVIELTALVRTLVGDP